MKDTVAIIFGDQLEYLRENREKVFELLKSANKDQRMGAILLLHRHFQLGSDIIAPLCWSFVMNDTDDGVRRCALHVLGITCASTFDAVTSKSLARIVLDSSESPLTRVFAYRSLRIVNAKALIPGIVDEEQSDRLAESISLSRHPKLDESQLDWTRQF